MEIRDKALLVAISQIGVEEKPRGSNKGPEVESYLKSVGLGGGFPWCQAFFYWCYQQAANELKITNPVIHTAGVLDCWNRTAVNFKISHEEAIKHPDFILPGYQFCLKEGKATGHTGMVESIDSKLGLVHTIEGNTNNDKSRDGYEVVRHTRKISEMDLLGFIKY